MTRSHPGIIRVLHLLLAVAFLGASGGSPYGLHGCPRHGAEGPTPGAHPVAAASVHHPSTSAPAPCRCVGDCHESAVTPHHVSGDEPRGATGTPTFETDQGAPRPSVRGPRHLLFELHLPNAPPLS